MGLRMGLWGAAGWLWSTRQLRHQAPCLTESCWCLCILLCDSFVQGVAAAQAGVSVVQPNVGRTRDWYNKHPGVIRDPHVSVWTAKCSLDRGATSWSCIDLCLMGGKVPVSTNASMSLWPMSSFLYMSLHASYTKQLGMFSLLTCCLAVLQYSCEHLDCCFGYADV